MGTHCFWWHILLAISTECWLGLKFISHIQKGWGRGGGQKENGFNLLFILSFGLLIFVNVLRNSAKELPS